MRILILVMIMLIGIGLASGESMSTHWIDLGVVESGQGLEMSIGFNEDHPSSSIFVENTTNFNTPYVREVVSFWKGNTSVKIHDDATGKQIYQKNYTDLIMDAHVTIFYKFRADLDYVPYDSAFDGVNKIHLEVKHVTNGGETFEDDETRSIRL